MVLTQPILSTTPGTTISLLPAARNRGIVVIILLPKERLVTVSPHVAPFRLTFFPPNVSKDPSSTSSPALANERKIDHQAIILEVNTTTHFMRLIVE